ncbi:MAG: inorganic pyrophosphatase [Deltaproteobacteria bacterium]|nr:MAG: inorganic pyrophosphatase [Deltaproteobacteria bacterium]
MSDDLDKLLETMFQAHPWHGVDPGDPAGVVQAFIEIAPTDTVKYELDKRSGHLKVDRPQRYSSQPPTLYGFIPQTYCGKRVGERCSERTGVPGVKGDGDPMDVCILTEKTMAHANFFLRARPIGGLRMVDGEEADDKIVAVLERDMAYGDLRDIADAPGGVVERLRHYFLTYKQMPGEPARTVRIAEVYDRVEAVEMIRRSLLDYRESFGPPEGRAALLSRLLGQRSS